MRSSLPISYVSGLRFGAQDVLKLTLLPSEYVGLANEVVERLTAISPKARLVVLLTASASVTLDEEDSGERTIQFVCTGARPIIRNPENKKLVTLLGSLTLTSTMIIVG